MAHTFVTVTGQGAFDLSYEGPNLQAHVLVQLSDQKEHAINKVMLRKGEIYGQSEIAVEFANQYLRSLGRK